MELTEEKARSYLCGNLEFYRHDRTNERVNRWKCIFVRGAECWLNLFRFGVHIVLWAQSVSFSGRDSFGG